jgi:hypothetical protein
MGAPAMLGKRVPDLVLVMDTEPGRKPELRVQCEIELSEDDAHEIYEALYGRDPGRRDVTRAHKKIKAKLGHQTSFFQQIVHLAFRDNGSTD